MIEKTSFPRDWRRKGTYRVTQKKPKEKKKRKEEGWREG